MSCANDNGVIRSDQDALTITLDTLMDLTVDVASVSIKFKRPDATSGEWTGSVVDNTKITHTLSVGEYLTPTGTWSFKAAVEFTDGSRATGQTVQKVVYGEW